MAPPPPGCALALIRRAAAWMDAPPRLAVRLMITWTSGACPLPLLEGRCVTCATLEPGALRRPCVLMMRCGHPMDVAGPWARLRIAVA